MRFWIKAIVALLVLVLVGINLSIYKTLRNRQEHYFRWVLKGASERRMALIGIDYILQAKDRWLTMSKGTPVEAESYFESPIDLKLQVFSSREVLPMELELFARFQDIRRAGYIPTWKDYRYVLTDAASGEDIDPFVRAGGRIEFSGVSRSPILGSGIDNDVLLSNILVRSDYDFTRFASHLYHYKFYNKQVVLRNKEYVFADTVREGDYPIPSEEILLRNEAARYNWCSGSGGRICCEEPEAVLREYGIIMRRRGGRYFPEYLNTGQPVEFPAKPVVVARSLQVLNKNASLYGKDFPTPEKYLWLIGSLHGAGEFHMPGIKGIVAKEFLDLYGVKFQWNKANQQYEKEADE